MKSEMEIRALYEIGERVIVKDLATLREELGDPINAQCGWYASGMNEYAGKGGIVSAVKEGINGGYYVYRLKGFGLWWFSEDTIQKSGKSYVVDVLDCTKGQGDLRTEMAEAARESLKADGYEAYVYYQMD